MKKSILILTFILFIFLTGFSSSDQLVIDDITKRIDTLESSNKAISNLNTQNTIDIMDLKKYQNVFFDATKIDKTYARLDTELGMFFISLDQAVKSNTGYKLTFLIGNPQYCTYKGLELFIRYNTKFDGTQKYLDWSKNEKTKDFTLSNVKLLPGYWNSVEIDIPATSINDLGYLELQMNLNTVSFSTLNSSITPSNDSVVIPSGPSTVSSGGVIESKIDGEFEGFSYGNIYKLVNGQIWEQTSATYKYKYKYSPEVIIYQSGSVYKMKVDGVEGEATVQRLK